MSGRWYKQLFLSQILKSKKSLQWSKPLSNATMPKDVSQCRDSTALSEFITVVICTALHVKEFPIIKLSKPINPSGVTSYFTGMSCTVVHQI